MDNRYKFCGYCEWFYYNDFDDGYMIFHDCMLHDEKDVDIYSMACSDFVFDRRFNGQQAD